MLTFACGICGISALNVAVPWLEEWVVLAKSGVVLGFVHDYREGELWPRLPVYLLCLLAATMFGPMSIPLWFLYAFLRVLICLRRGRGILRAAALLWLLLCASGAVWRSYQATTLTRSDYLMTRFLSGGYLSELSEQQPFPLEKTVQKLIQGSPREAHNAALVLELRALKSEPDKSAKLRMKTWLREVPATRREDRLRVETAYKL